MNDLTADREGHAPGIRLAAIRKLLYLLMANLPVVRFLHYSGVLLLLVSLLAWTWSAKVAFGLAIYAWVAALVVPYLVAVPVQRSLIGMRRLVLVPHFPLASGLALLGIAILLSVSLPLAMVLFGVPLPAEQFAPRIFVIASLYAAALQYCLVSRFGALLLSTLPFVLAILINEYNALLGALWASTGVVTVLFLASVAGWARALQLLAKGSAFRTPFQSGDPLLLRGDAYQQQHARQWLPAYGASKPEESLLLGFHASFVGRLASMGHILLLSPLMVAFFMTLIGDRNWSAQHYFELVMLVHLFMVASFPWSWGELAPRTRLLWLKLPGRREDFWQSLIGLVCRQYALMFSLTLLLALFVLVLDFAFGQQYLHVLLVVFATSLHSGYLGLLSRLYYWPGWSQAVVMSFTVLVVGLTLVFSLQGQHTLPIWILASTLLLLVLLYHWRCKRAFLAVDWLRLKPLGPIRKGPAAA